MLGWHQGIFLLSEVYGPTWSMRSGSKVASWMRRVHPWPAAARALQGRVSPL